jgi:hypothetical protein
MGFLLSAPVPVVNRYFGDPLQLFNSNVSPTMTFVSVASAAVKIANVASTDIPGVLR